MEYESWEPLHEIAQMAWCDASLRQLQQWHLNRATTDFPEAKETIGRYNFFDPEEVKRWYTLWRKATRNMGRGAELNARSAE